MAEKSKPVIANDKYLINFMVVYLYAR
jgi:hypothetical protein